MNLSNVCVGYETYARISEYSPIIDDYILFPICTTLGICGHSICLLAFYRQAKCGEITYKYQVFLSAIELLVSVSRIQFSLCYHFLSGYTSRLGVDWFMSSYPC